MNVLITGGTGFIGSHLARFLHKKGENVTLFDIEPDLGLVDDIKCELGLVKGDLACLSDLLSAVKNNKVEIIYHTGALLSAKAEKYPVAGFRTNLIGTFNVLEAARLFDVEMVIFPSSIAAFGEGVSNPVPNEAYQRPTTMYGVAKVAGEILGEYYHRRFEVNFRCLRLPSVVGPGRGSGGVSAYSTLMIEKPARGESYQVYVGQNSRMPILYIKDALRAFSGLQKADEAKLKRRVYNIGGISPTAGQIAESVRRHVKGARLEFNPDRGMQEIVDSWPEALDETRAREEWGWVVKYRLDDMVEDFVKEVRSFGG
ncbi:MAG: NAD-dependent epimerase/dehydratase family protein [Candidatus Aerophobetes bacterium]